MTRAPRVAPQDPSLSPTYSLSANPTEQQQSVRPSIRRNLFSAHLSRRPVSTTASAIFAPPSPTHQHAPSRHDVFSSGPALHPSKRVMDRQDIYDPNASPPHAPSPATASNLFPRESIIAVHPATGRPLLPNLPSLPPRLRLTDEDDEEAASDEEMDRREYLDYHHSYPRSPSHTRNNYGPSSDYDFDQDVDLDSSDLNFIGISRGQNVISSFAHAMDNEGDRQGRERIERLLADMMTQQRQRAKTVTSFDASTTGLSTASSVMAGVSSTSRAAARGAKSRQRMADNTPSVRFEAPKSATEPAIGGVGVTMDPGEKDELMGLIMTSLRRKLQHAEDEGWMYGGPDGLGGIGSGADQAGDGIYE